MGGREALTMEPANENISFKREKGCFLSAFTIFLLFLGFLAIVIGTGLIVYYFADKTTDQQGLEYKVIDHHNRADHHYTMATEGKISADKNDKGMMKPTEKDMSKKPKKAKVMDVRLPRSIKPLHYLVKLISFINGNFSINGFSELTFEVMEDTKNITLHINGIETKNETVQVMEVSSGSKISVMKHMYDKDREFYIAHLQENIKKGMKYKISMNFVAFLNDNMNGFYRSSYEDDQGKTRWLAATQFQATDARKAFPCLDEPALKANFTIELAREEKMTSLSNMPLMASVPMEGHSGWYWDRFETSVPMSTYLVAFVVSDFAHVKSVDDNAYDFRVYARNSAISQANYSLKIGPPASKFFEEYFNVPFPLPKQDMIALPDFSAGAMENWGLITYRETAMLYDPKISTASNKFYVGSVIVHELAHQWFGNLVTPTWWTDLWLNEGFASYMEYIGLNAVEPTFKMMEQFVITDLQLVFRLDCLESSHPINIEVKHPDEINEIFDRISYSKGASIIRMMNLFLGESTFRGGLSNYLKAMAYSSAVQDDLWRFLTEQAHKDNTLSKDMTVKTIMDTWTLQMGFPVITFKNNMDGTAMIKQERFLLVKNPNSTNTHDYKWWVPITYVTKSDPNFNDSKPKLWMKPSEETKTISGMPQNKEWVILNVHQAGYYRVNYDQRNWDAIINQLLQNHLVIDTINRAQILDDSLALSRAGLLPYSTTMKVLSYLKNEEDYVPLSAAITNLNFISRMFSHTGGFGALSQFYLSLLKPIYDKVGFEDNTSDPHLDQRKRSLILSMMCKLGHPDCVNRAVDMYKRWMQNPQEKSIVSPNLKTLVYCTAIREGGIKEWQFAWDQYQNANLAAEKRILMRAMGCTKQSWIQGGYLKRALALDEGIRKQDVSSVIAAVSHTTQGKLIAWNFLKDNWMKIYELFGQGSFTLDGIVKVVSKSLNTRNLLKELEDFRDTHADYLGSAQRAVSQSVEGIENNVQWMDKYYDVILKWLNEHGYNNNI